LSRRSGLNTQRPMNNNMNNYATTQNTPRPQRIVNSYATQQQNSVQFSRTCILSEVRLRVENLVDREDFFYKYIKQVMPSEVPWIAGIAGNYDRYKWNFVQFRYVTAMASDVNGTAWFGFNYIEAPAGRHDDPASFIAAQQLDKFTSVGACANSNWVNCPTGVLNDRWFMTRYSATDPMDSCPMNIIYGLNSVNRKGTAIRRETVIGYIEMKYTITLSQPAISPTIVNPLPPALEEDEPGRTRTSLSSTLLPSQVNSSKYVKKSVEGQEEEEEQS